MKKDKLIIFFIVLSACILFFPSLTNFFSHDDFFHLKIARVESIGEFLNFYNLKTPAEGFGMYRPISIQSFYSIAWFTGLNPVVLHVVSMIFFVSLLFLVYIFFFKLTSNSKTSLVATFIYAVSSVHFSNLYFLGEFQEISLVFFSVLFLIFHLDYLESKKIKYYFYSFLTFLLALACKETALVLPFIGCTLFYLKSKKLSLKSINNLMKYLFPYLLLIVVYFYFRINYFGFPKGDSYIWDFSVSRIPNTIAWYLAWSINIPEMLVDFVGPRLKVDFTPLITWKYYLYAIFISISSFLLIILSIAHKNIKKLKKDLRLFILSGIIFVIPLVPVLFLPWHKFSYYLTLPMVGVALALSTVLGRISNKLIIVTLMFWLVSSVVNIKLLEKTHWIATGPKIARNVYNYFYTHEKELNGKTVVFYDDPDSVKSVWNATQTLKITLSDEDFFDIFFPNIGNVVYSEGGSDHDNEIKIKSNSFINY